ncbi:MAG: MoaD/ThiS family protein [Microthrixaceae bacterium]
MIVHLRQPTRQVSFDRSLTVTALLSRLGINRETVLVIRNGTLVPGDERLDADDEVEIRPVVSGG